MSLERDLARFAALDAIRIDGTQWYRYAQVCRALRAPERTGSKVVDAAHKRRYFEFHRGYRSTVILLLDRAGVEQMVIRYARAPRAALMAALDGAHEAKAVQCSVERSQRGASFCKAAAEHCVALQGMDRLGDREAE